MTEQERIERQKKCNVAQQFSGNGITAEERDFYLILLQNCKDICEPINLPKGVKGQLFKVIMHKIYNKISFSGLVSYQLLNNERENRCIEGEILTNKEYIDIDMKVTRLNVKEDIKEYRTFDQYKIVNNEIVARSSSYNKGLLKEIDEVNINIGGRKL